MISKFEIQNDWLVNNQWSRSSSRDPLGSWFSGPDNLNQLAFTEFSDIMNWKLNAFLNLDLNVLLKAWKKSWRSINQIPENITLA